MIPLDVKTGSAATAAYLLLKGHRPVRITEDTRREQPFYIFSPDAEADLRVFLGAKQEAERMGADALRRKN